MILKMPFIERSSLPSHLKDHGPQLHTSMKDWLASSEFVIAERKWRAFWVDDSPPKATKDRPSYNKIYLFAVGGRGLDALTDSRPDRRPTSIKDFLNLHMPIAANIKSTNLKLFTRLKLGLSKTIPTVVLEKEHVRIEKDKYSADSKHVMNDGCALMSAALGAAIARVLGLTATPSAFQGRFGGAKGLWIVDQRDLQGVGSKDYWIEITESQLKVKPHPAVRDGPPEYRTFEVSDWSRPSQQSALNTQFINVLRDRKVARQALEDCVREHIGNYYYHDFCNGMSDPLALRSWVQKYHQMPRDSDVELRGSFPRDRTEKMNMLLETGFTARESDSPLRHLSRVTIKDYLTKWAEKLRISIADESTFLYCIADPYDVLQQGEVFCAMSKPWKDPQSGQESNFVHGFDGLVARNPANHPSDIQRVKFVFNTELQNFRDVIIFPSKGKRSLASLLSGGDYDGDEVWICWRQSIVRSFENYKHGPPDHISAADCDLVERSTPLDQLITEDFNDYSVIALLSTCFDFNLRVPMVGKCTVAHETLVYHKSLQDPGAIKLAALASFLVDARKQGLELTEQAFRKVRNECYGTSRELSKPAYKNSQEPVQCNNIIDYLRFKIAQKAVDDALTHFHQNWSTCLEYNSLFTLTWRKAWERSEKDRVARHVLIELRNGVQTVYQLWADSVGRRLEEDPDSYPMMVLACFDKLQAIEPDTKLGFIDIHHRFEDERRRRYSYWNLLRAACFYSEHSKKHFTWHMVGQELCFLRAEDTGDMRTFTGRMYAVTKIDSKAVRSRLALTDDEVAAEEDEFSGPMDAFIQRR